MVMQIKLIVVVVASQARGQRCSSAVNTSNFGCGGLGSSFTVETVVETRVVVRRTGRPDGSLGSCAKCF